MSEEINEGKYYAEYVRIAKKKGEITDADMPGGTHLKWDEARAVKLHFTNNHRASNSL